MILDQIRLRGIPASCASLAPCLTFLRNGTLVRISTPSRPGPDMILFQRILCPFLPFLAWLSFGVWLRFDLIILTMSKVKRGPWRPLWNSPNAGGDDALRDCDQHVAMCPSLQLLQQQEGLGSRVKFHKGATPSALQLNRISPSWIMLLVRRRFFSRLFWWNKLRCAAVQGSWQPSSLPVWQSLLSEQIFLQPQNHNQPTLPLFPLLGSKLNSFEYQKTTYWLSILAFVIPSFCFTDSQFLVMSACSYSLFC